MGGRRRTQPRRLLGRTRTFYADWTQRIDGERYPRVTAYRERLKAWAPFARAVEEARPFRAYFPLGAPDRD